MKHRPKRVLLISSVSLATLFFCGISSAATLFGFAQPGWENDAISSGPSFDSYIVSNRNYSPQATVLQIDFTDGNRGPVLGEGAISGESSNLFQRGSSEISAIWAASNPSAATDWLSSAINTDESRQDLRSFTETWTYFDAPLVVDIGGSEVEVHAGNFIQTVDPIPEPSSALLGAIGGFLLLRRRRTS
jgi:hypothetical protein